MFELCLVKPLLACILYVLNIGVVFIKSQKILQAFLCKVRLTAEEINKTIIMQFFIVFIFILCVGSVLLIAHFQQPMDLTLIEESQSMKRFLVCNTHLHTGLVISSIMFIQLMCAIQAFRGRNLPSIMNDGMVLTYLTFTLTIVFAVRFVMIQFQPVTKKEVFQTIFITIISSFVF